jgi:small-conductance mechanosensitive channel
LDLLKLAEIVGLIAAAWFVVRLLLLAMSKYSKQWAASQAEQSTIKRWVDALAIFTAILGVVEILGLGSQLEVLTFAGIGVIIAGLVLQRFLSSILYGLIAFKEDAMRVGDVVEISGAGKGRIVKIKLTRIWVETDSGALLQIDMTVLESGRYWNYTARERLKKDFNR